LSWVAPRTMTKYVHQSHSSQANSSSPSQKIACVSPNQKFRCRSQTSYSEPVYIIQSKPSHNIPFYLHIYVYVFQVIVLFRFPHQNSVPTYLLPDFCNMLGHFTRVIFGDEWKTRSKSLCSVFCLTACFLLGANTFRPTLFTIALTLYSSFNLEYQVSNWQK
jgi:hypothetical protein